MLTLQKSGIFGKFSKNDINITMHRKNYKTLLSSFLQGENLPDFQSLKKEILRLIQKTLKIYFTPEVEAILKKHYKNDYLEELFQETLLKLLFSRGTLLRLSFISEAYLLTLIKNVIYFCLSAKCRALKYEMSFEEVREKWKERFENSEEIEKVRAEEIVAQLSFDYLKEVKAEELLEILKKILTPKERETLCYYLYRVFEPPAEVEEKKKGTSVLYKRWERLKEKIRKKFGKDLEGEEEIFKNTLKKFFERICQKREEKRVKRN